MGNILGVPSVAGLTQFLRDNGITATVLPDSSPTIALWFSISSTIVSEWLAAIDSDLYTFAIYNLATDRIITYASDQSGQTFFADLRIKFGTNSFSGGLVQSAADEGTSSTLATTEAFKRLTISDLQSLKTPYGRAYLAIAQDLGSLWGIS